MRDILKALLGQKIVVVFDDDTSAVGTLSRRHGGQGGRYVLLSGKRGRPTHIKPSEVIVAVALPVAEAETEAEREVDAA